MKKFLNRKNIRKIIISIGILTLIIFIINIGFNFWLQKALPKYLLNNTDYKIQYDQLNVRLENGDIFASNVKIKTLNTENKELIKVYGKIDSMKITRFEIFKALFLKKIHTTNIELTRPNLHIILNQPKNNKTEKKPPLYFDKIKIKDGNIKIDQYNNLPFIYVENLNLFFTKLKISENNQEIPISFDKYDINGKDFYFQPDDIYSLKSSNLYTKNGEIHLKNFSLSPLMSYTEFKKKYPKKRNLFSVVAPNIYFTNFSIENNELALSEVKFDQPKVQMHTTSQNPDKNEKSFKYIVDLKNFILNDGSLEIFSENENLLFSTQNLNIKSQQLKMNEETARGNIPFMYEDFDISGKSLIFNGKEQTVSVKNYAVNPKSAQLNHTSVKPKNMSSPKTKLDLAIAQIRLNVNHWEMKNDKLKLDAEALKINNIEGNIFTENSSKNSTPPDFSGIDFPLLVRDFSVDHSQIRIIKNEQNFDLKNINIKAKNVEMNEKTIENKLPFTSETFIATIQQTSSKLNKFYAMKSGNVKIEKNKISVEQFALSPLVSRGQFIQMIASEKDLYDLKINNIKANGNFDLFSKKPSIKGEQVTIHSLDANVFRSKIPKDDTSVKPMYSELLRSIKLPLLIKNIDIKNSNLVYEEDTKKSDGPGKLSFGNLNMNIKNLNSAKFKNTPTPVPISISCDFMNSSPMNVKWVLDPAKTNDDFSISGKILSLPAKNINPFVEPYLKIKTEGNISSLNFDFHGNKTGIQGKMNMHHQELKVNFLKESGEKNKFLSGVANLFIRSNSKKRINEVEVKKVERDNTKSFFNLFWKGIESGLVSTLIK